MNICMETMCVRMEVKFWSRKLDTWSGTLSFVYGLGLETPKLISC